MNQATQRLIENIVLSRTLDKIAHPENLQHLAGLIQDHDHFAEVLLTEPDRARRYAKFEFMRAYVRFETMPLSWYELPKGTRGSIIIPRKNN